MPEENEEMFLTILKKLHDGGALKDMVLIGSWCLLFYKQLFPDDPLLPAVRTMDMDLLVPYPRKRRKSVNVTELLESLGFEVKFSFTTGYYKYIKDDIVVEFLMPLRGSGKVAVEKVESLGITVQGLRHLSYSEDELTTLSYKGCTVKLPKPETTKNLIIAFKTFSKKQQKNLLRITKEKALAVHEVLAGE